jgi:hypothetical protein
MKNAKPGTTIITYYASEQEDEQITKLTDHQGGWYNPSEDYYVMEDPSERTLLILHLLGVELDWIKGEKSWHAYVVKTIQENERARRNRRLK